MNAHDPDATPHVARPQPQGLADVLDRILDKGLVIAGDISISIVNVELLTIRIRLLIASIDKAQEMGIDWWAREPHLTAGGNRNGETGKLEDQQEDLNRRFERLEKRLDKLLESPEGAPTQQKSARRKTASSSSSSQNKGKSK